MDVQVNYSDQQQGIITTPRKEFQLDGLPYSFLMAVLAIRHLEQTPDRITRWQLNDCDLSVKLESFSQIL
jgi:hypothetical protein